MGLISDRLNRIAPSPTVSITDMALNMKAAGRKVIGLAAGEPDFDTPQHIKDAANAALKSAQPELMRGVTRGVVNKNAASRKISRLSRRIKAI